MDSSELVWKGASCERSTGSSFGSPDIAETMPRRSWMKGAANVCQNGLERNGLDDSPDCAATEKALSRSQLPSQERARFRSVSLGVVGGGDGGAVVGAALMNSSASAHWSDRSADAAPTNAASSVRRRIVRTMLCERSRELVSGCTTTFFIPSNEAASKKPEQLGHWGCQRTGAHGVMHRRVCGPITIKSFSCS